MRTPIGPILITIQALLFLVLFSVILTSYIMVWYKLNAASKSRANGAGSKHKYNSAAQTMMLFVAAFLIQWWFLILFGTWALLSLPHVSEVIQVVFFCNLGGVFNLIAYTEIDPKRLQQKTTQTTTLEIWCANDQTEFERVLLFTVFVTSTCIAMLPGNELYHTYIFLL